MIRLLPRHHPAADPSPPFPLCPAAGQRGSGGEGLAEAQLPHIFSRWRLSVCPWAEVRLPLTRPRHSPPVGGAMPQRAAAYGNRERGSRSPGRIDVSITGQ